MKCCDIYPGQFRDRVIFEAQVSTDIGGGAKQITRNPYLTGFGRFKPVSGSERLYAQRIDAVTNNRLTVHYTAQIKESDTVVCRGRRYNITFLDNVEHMDKYLIIDLDGGVAL
jgi:SPP1 family predicted phage head-tail adaptor